MKRALIKINHTRRWS